MFYAFLSSAGKIQWFSAVLSNICNRQDLWFLRLVIKGYENMNYSTLPDYGLLTGLSIVTVIMERNGYIVNCRIFYQSFHAVCT